MVHLHLFISSKPRLMIFPMQDVPNIVDPSEINQSYEVHQWNLDEKSIAVLSNSIFLDPNRLPTGITLSRIPTDPRVFPSEQEVVKKKRQWITIESSTVPNFFSSLPWCRDHGQAACRRDPGTRWLGWASRATVSPRPSVAVYSTMTRKPWQLIWWSRRWSVLDLYLKLYWLGYASIAN